MKCIEPLYIGNWILSRSSSLSSTKKEIIIYLLRNLCPFINTTFNLRIPNKSNPFFPNFPLLLLSAEEEDHEALGFENIITLVQDRVFVCGDYAVVGAMAKYNTTRKEVAANLREMCTLGKSDAWLFIHVVKQGG
ncbi:hypothetical protein E2542_SST11208 [Spatholobus suberectus]|nr:hypothetical protein E2542_SST11208 [Spatholobus suberectus]